MRYRLRTLLVLMAILPPLIAGAWLVLTLRPAGSTTINGSQVVVFRGSFLGGVGISSNDKSVTANFGRQTVFVDAKKVDIIGLRTVQLPASWARVELIRSGNDVQVVLDGTPVK